MKKVTATYLAFFIIIYLLFFFLATKTHARPLKCETVKQEVRVYRDMARQAYADVLMSKDVFDVCYQLENAGLDVHKKTCSNSLQVLNVDLFLYTESRKRSRELVNKSKICKLKGGK